MMRRLPLRTFLVLALVPSGAGAWAQNTAKPDEPLPGTILLEPPKQTKPGDAPSKPATSAIIDTAGMFTENALRSARAALQALTERRGVPVTIETLDSLAGADVVEEARRRAEEEGRKGVFILISRRDAKLEVLVSAAYRDKLLQAGRKAVQDALVAKFKERQFDEGLARAVATLDAELGQVSAAATTTVVSAPVSNSPLVARGQVHLTLAGARRVLAAAEAEAVRLNLKSNIAVVDDGGHLIAFVRMDGGRPASVATATTKAIAAATFRQATGPIPAGASNPDPLLNLSLQNAASDGGGRITSLLGGLPITVDGQVIGGVGVGGGTGEQDAEVARAGINALLDDLKAVVPKP